MAKSAKPAFTVSSLRTASAKNATRIKVQAGMLVPATGTQAKLGLAVEAATATGIKPGVDRWSVKTGTDKDVGKVNLRAGVVNTTVEELHKAARPKGMPDPRKKYKAFDNARAAPVETTIWRIDCRITAVKLEADGDYHLVLQGSSGESFIGEIPFPSPAFVNPKSPFAADIKSARDAVDKKIFKKLSAHLFAPMGKYMVPPGAFAQAPKKTMTMQAVFATAATAASTSPLGLTFKTAITPVKARITGVGFFDDVHGQMGVAPNGIELHPILRVEFL